MPEMLRGIQPFPEPWNPFARSNLALLQEIGEKVFALWQVLPDIEDTIDLANLFVRRGAAVRVFKARIVGNTQIVPNIWAYDWIEQEPILNSPFYQDKPNGLASTGAGGNETLAMNGVEHQNPPTQPMDPMSDQTRASAGVKLGTDGTVEIELVPIRTNAIVLMESQVYVIDPGPPPVTEKRYTFGIGNDVDAECASGPAPLSTLIRQRRLVPPT